MIKYKKSGSLYILTEKIHRDTEIKPHKPINGINSYMGTSGRIVLLPGYKWDGATGALDTPDIMESSAFHDFICTEYENGHLTKAQRKQGDKLFKQMNKETDMPSARVKWTFQAVRKFFEVKEWFKKLF